MQPPEAAAALRRGRSTDTPPPAPTPAPTPPQVHTASRRPSGEHGRPPTPGSGGGGGAPRRPPSPRVGGGGGGGNHGASDLASRQPWPARLRSLRTRTLSTALMLAGFAAVLWAGHVVVCVFIMCIQVAMVAELFALAAQKSVEKGLPGFRSQQWYFFACAAFAVYGRLLKNNLLAEVAFNADWLPPAVGWTVRHHSLVAYTGYTAGFVLFVTSLKKSTYMYQFSQFAWTHMILLVILLQSSFFVANIMEGLIWFVLPSSLVVVNDIMAYVFGFFFGRTPLIKLSPKKTWEGFLGALVSTLVVSFFLSRFLARFDWLICPRTDLTVRTWLRCERANTFRALPVAEALAPLMEAGWPSFVKARLQAAVALAGPNATLMPLQLHALSFALFAAVIAPFGGFFASGFKRALRVKDFGDSIPGHGGITDRMDCQVIMAAFSYLYVDSIVGLGDVTVAGLVEKAQRLGPAELDELHRLVAQMAGKPCPH